MTTTTLQSYTQNRKHETFTGYYSLELPATVFVVHPKHATSEVGGIVRGRPDIEVIVLPMLPECCSSTQCPTTGCYNDLLPDQTECTHCARARAEYECAGFTIRANYYADGVCIECGETVEAGDYCHEHAQDHVPEDVKAMQPRKGEQMTTDARPHQVSPHDRVVILGRATDQQRQEVERVNREIVAKLTAILALLFAFSAHTTHAAAYTPTAPVGCTVTHFASQDDLSATAVCAGGYIITKEDGPRDLWNDVLWAAGTMLVGPDANGQYHEYVTFD